MHIGRSLLVFPILNLACSSAIKRESKSSPNDFHTFGAQLILGQIDSSSEELAIREFPRAGSPGGGDTILTLSTRGRFSGSAISPILTYGAALMRGASEFQSLKNASSFFENPITTHMRNRQQRTYPPFLISDLNRCINRTEYSGSVFYIPANTCPDVVISIGANHSVSGVRDITHRIHLLSRRTLRIRVAIEGSLGKTEQNITSPKHSHFWMPTRDSVRVVILRNRRQCQDPLFNFGCDSGANIFLTATLSAQTSLSASPSCDCIFGGAGANCRPKVWIASAHKRFRIP